jgi:hypothetical protein
MNLESLRQGRGGGKNLLMDFSCNIDFEDSLGKVVYLRIVSFIFSCSLPFSMR